jgi:phosphoglycerate-specific signal transduction histidine kinase
MEKIFIIFVVLLVSCSKSRVTKKEVVAIDTIFSNNVENMDSLLIKTEGLEDNVEQVVNYKDILRVENSDLKNENFNLKEEIATTKDCLVIANKKINEYKVPKKRSLFDKVIGANKDSITVIDTIK